MTYHCNIQLVLPIGKPEFEVGNRVFDPKNKLTVLAKIVIFTDPLSV